jgi:uncharacterized protein (TIGR03067 family)
MPFMVAIGTLLTIGATPAATDDSTADGTWQAVTAELAGKPFPQQITDSITLVVKDGGYLVMVGDKPDKGTVKVDTSKTPHTMDITGTEGPNKGKTFLCIYEVKGDKLKVCYDLSGKARPSEFKTEPNTLLYLVEYQRKK